MESFVGRRHELGAVRSAVSQGESVVVIGGRRSGKTWLLQQIGDVGPAWLRKHWTRVEYDAARATHGEHLFLLSMDGALPPDWSSGHIYENGTAANLVGLVDRLVKRVQARRPG